MLDCIEIYDNQKKAIMWIKDTEWYKEIKKYWQREVESCRANYMTVKAEDLYKLQERDKIWTAFLTFLNNLELLSAVTP